MAKALAICRETGELPQDLKSHDDLNILDPVPVQQETFVWIQHLLLFRFYL